MLSHLRVGTTSAMKSVLIIGAGPAGLVTAKTLLQRKGHFAVTVMEKQPRVGGLWAVSKACTDSILDPYMPTNLSKYTVGFSDLSWDSVDLGKEDYADGFGNADSAMQVPMFPLAWQVGRYLDTYAKAFIPEGVIRCSKTVLSADIAAADEGSRWEVTWADSADVQSIGSGDLLKDEANRCSKASFDYLVIASGFFASPKSFLDSFSHDLGFAEKTSPSIAHSSSLRNIDDFVTKQSTSPGNLVVVGGSMSGVEAASSLAFQLSTKKFSPGQGLASSHNIIHVCSKPFYALPPIIPAEGLTSSTHSFAPLDLCLYDLERRPAGDISSAFGKMPCEKARAAHKNIRAFIGSDQGDLSDALVYDDTNRPAYVAISERYAEFVRSGDIQPMSGRVVSLATGSDEITNGDSIDLPPLEILVERNGKVTQIENVQGLVYATGFSPYSALHFLPEKIQRKLMNVDERCLRLPIVLDEHYTSPRCLPSIALIGFYEGPYWGVMEMQARYITRKWSRDIEQSSFASTSASGPDSDSLEQLRKGIMQKDTSIPQFWMGDYLGIMEEMSRELEIERDDSGFKPRSGPTLAARYVAKDDNRVEAQTTLQSLRTTLDASARGTGFATRAAFRAMQGNWNMQRDLNSALATFPSGTVSGKAHFHPRTPTDAHFDAEYLYIENGTFSTNQGFTMQATRRYVYRYNERNDQISVWFVKDDGKAVDYLFHNLKLHPRKIPDIRSVWEANADHLCVHDMYKTSYEFCFQGVALKALQVTHSVEGPKKNYVSITRYSRYTE